MDLNLLPVFVTVAEVASFSAAAAKLEVKRSSVSRSIAALERSLGVRLFNRTTRQVSLTTAGAALHARLAPQLAALKQSVGTLPEQEELPSGELRITAPVDLGVIVLPGIVASFSTRYPGVRIDVRLSNHVVDVVAEGFDAALRLIVGKLADSTLVARRLTEIQIQVFASPTYLARIGAPRTPADTADHRWIYHRGLPPPKAFPVARDPAQLVGDDILFVHQAARAGAGLAILPAFVARDDVASGALVRVLPHVSMSSGQLYFVHPSTKHLPRKVTAFRDHVLQHLSAHPLAGVGSAA